MRTGPDHERWADSIGAYLLEALPDDEREGFEAHLADCPTCRRDIDELRVAADALPMSVEPVAPPAALQGRVMTVVRAEAELLAASGPGADRPEPAADPGRDVEEAAPGRTSAARGRRAGGRGRLSGGRFLGGVLERPAFALACALVLLVLGGAGGALLRGGGGDEAPGPRPPALRTTAAQIDAARAPNASVRLEQRDGSARLVVRDMPAPPAGRLYQVWLKRPGQSPEPMPVLWAPRRDGSAEVYVPGRLDGVDAVLVTDEPRGGAQIPSKAPVITAVPA